MSGEPVLAMDRVSMVTGAVRLLDTINLAIHAGERVAITGESGSGKSMILRLVTGLARPLTGTIKLFGQDLASVSPASQRLLRGRCAITFQHGSLISGLSVEDNLWLGLHVAAAARPRLRRRLDRATVDFGLENLGQAPVDALSPGERRRVELARAFLREPELVLLDEPLEGSRATAPLLEQQITRQVVGRGRALLLLTQDAALAQRLCDRVLHLAQGRLA